MKSYKIDQWVREKGRLENEIKAAKEIIVVCAKKGKGLWKMQNYRRDRRWQGYSQYIKREGKKL